MLALRFNTSALDEMFNLANEFESALSGTTGAGQRRSTWTPAVEVHETEDLVSMAVELPGVDPRNVRLSVQNGILSITGEKQPALTQDGQTVHYSERWYGRFERTFALPSAIEPGRIEASYDAGILTIRLHKSEQAKPRQIEIATGAQAQIGGGQR